MKRASLWLENIPKTDFPTQFKDINTDILIIGGGLTGILTGHMLKEKGLNPLIIDSNKAYGGTSSYSTAKITSQHRLIYTDISDKISKEKAQMYATANQNAIYNYIKLIKENNINCDFKEATAYVYTTDKKYLEQIEREVDYGNRFGINAFFTKDTELPFKVLGAVGFLGQGEFNPSKFMSALGENLHILENTTAHAVEGNTVITNRGRINARYIILACHFPFINFPGYYFMRMHQERSYLLALENAPILKNMYVDANENGYTFRSYQNYTIFGGESHKTGKNHSYERYNNLLFKASELFPKSKAVMGWSAQDCITLDKIPYIGKFSEDTPHILVATGYNKWGITSSMVAAEILCKTITDTPPEYAEVFSPQRFNLTASMKDIAQNSLQATTSILAQVVGIPSHTTDALPSGHGGVVEYDNQKAGVYKTDSGKIYAVSIKCPHLGCQLEWNPEEKSWDCPCHGSRFDYKGYRLNGPATQCLEKPITEVEQK